MIFIVKNHEIFSVFTVWEAEILSLTSANHCVFDLRFSSFSSVFRIFVGFFRENCSLRKMVKPPERKKKKNPSQPNPSEGLAARSARWMRSSGHSDGQGSIESNASENNRNDAANTVQNRSPGQICLERDSPEDRSNYANELLLIITSLHEHGNVDTTRLDLTHSHFHSHNSRSEYIPAGTVTASIQNLFYWIWESSFMSDKQSSKQAEIGAKGTISLSTVLDLLKPLSEQFIYENICYKLGSECSSQNKIIPVHKLEIAIDHSLKWLLDASVSMDNGITIKHLFQHLRVFFTSFNVDDLLEEEITLIDEISSEFSNGQFYGELQNIIGEWIAYFKLASVEKRGKNHFTTSNVFRKLLQLTNHLGIEKSVEMMEILETITRDADNRELVVPRRHFKCLAQQAMRMFLSNNEKVEFPVYHEAIWNKSDKRFEELFKNGDEKDEQNSDEDEEDVGNIMELAPYEKMPKMLTLRHMMNNISSITDGAILTSDPVQSFRSKWSILFGRVGNKISLFLRCDNDETGSWLIDADLRLRVLSINTQKWEEKNMVVTFKQDMHDKSVGFLHFMDWSEMERYFSLNNQLLLEVEVTFTRMEGLSRKEIRHFDRRDVCYDAVLVAGGQKFYFNKYMLAKQSSYFEEKVSEDHRKWKTYEMNFENVDRKDWQCFLEMLHLEQVLDDDNVEGVLCLSMKMQAQNITRLAEEFLLSGRSKDSMAKKLELAVRFRLENLRKYVFESLKTKLDLRAVHTNHLKDFDPSVLTDLRNISSILI